MEIVFRLRSQVGQGIGGFVEDLVDQDAVVDAFIAYDAADSRDVATFCAADARKPVVEMGAVNDRDGQILEDAGGVKHATRNAVFGPCTMDFASTLFEETGKELSCTYGDGAALRNPPVLVFGMLDLVDLDREGVCGNAVALLLACDAAMDVLDLSNEDSAGEVETVIVHAPGPGHLGTDKLGVPEVDAKGFGELGLEHSQTVVAPLQRALVVQGGDGLMHPVQAHHQLLCGFDEGGDFWVATDRVSKSHDQILGRLDRLWSGPRARRFRVFRALGQLSPEDLEGCTNDRAVAG